MIIPEKKPNHDKQTDRSLFTAQGPRLWHLARTLDEAMTISPWLAVLAPARHNTSRFTFIYG